MTRRSTKVRGASLLAVACAVAVLAACQPVDHPTVVVRETATSPVTFRLLAAQGRFAVVSSTGPSVTVPGTGVWRVDRVTGATAKLPGTDIPTRISADGRRILLADNRLWTSGSISVPPAGAVFSPDLMAAAYRGLDGTIKSRRLSDGTVFAAEALPRPAGYGVAAAAVSDDARTVEYRLVGMNPRVRFVDLDAGSLVDLPDQTLDTDIYAHEWYALSADGSRFAHLLEFGGFNFNTGQSGAVTTLELVDTVTGAVVSHWDGTTDQMTRTLHIGASGDVAWLYQEQFKLMPGGFCSGSPTNAICVTQSSVVALEAGGVHVTPLGPNAAGTINMSRNGRFLLVDKDLTPFPGSIHVFVVDWKANHTEALPAVATYTETDSVQCRASGFPAGAPCTLGVSESNAQITDDAKVIAAQGGNRIIAPTGWYEFRSAS